MITKFKIFENFIGFISQDVEINITIDDTEHSRIRKDERNINDEEIKNIVEKAIDILTIDLINKKVKVGQKFIIEEEDVHLVCVMENSKNKVFNLKVVTVMRDIDSPFRKAEWEYCIDVGKGESYLFHTKRPPDIIEK